MKKSVEFYERVLAGEERTIANWAIELFGDDDLKNRVKIGAFMRSLRRKDVMIFPVKRGEGTGGGIVEVINSKPVEFLATVNRLQRNNVEPMIINSFRYLEVMIDEHPKLKEKAVAMAKHVLSIAYEKEKRILGIGYVPSGLSTLPAKNRSEAGQNHL